MATLVREIKYFPLEGVLRVTFDSYTFSSYVDEPVEANFFVLHGIDHSGQETGEIVGFEYDLFKLEKYIGEPLPVAESPVQPEPAPAKSAAS